MFSSRQILDLLSLITIVENVRYFAAKNSLHMKVDQNYEHKDANGLVESTTMQVAHEELNDVDDPTEEINHGWIMIKKTTR